MIVVPIKEGENIERALKKLKRKFEKTGVVKELRERQKFTKPSVIARERKMKAIYVQQLRQSELDKQASVLTNQEKKMSLRTSFFCPNTKADPHKRGTENKKAQN